MYNDYKVDDEDTLYRITAKGLLALAEQGGDVDDQDWYRHMAYVEEQLNIYQLGTLAQDEAIVFLLDRIHAALDADDLSLLEDVDHWVAQVPIDEIEDTLEEFEDDDED